MLPWQRLHWHSLVRHYEPHGQIEYRWVNGMDGLRAYQALRDEAKSSHLKGEGTAECISEWSIQ